jgi:hypothetical protein
VAFVVTHAPTQAAVNAAADQVANITALDAGLAGGNVTVEILGTADALLATVVQVLPATNFVGSARELNAGAKISQTIVAQGTPLKIRVKRNDGTAIFAIDARVAISDTAEYIAGYISFKNSIENTPAGQSINVAWKVGANPALPLGNSSGGGSGLLLASFTYVGAFASPNDPEIDFTNGTIAVDPSDGNLFLVGSRIAPSSAGRQRIAKIVPPATLSTSNVLADLPRATVSGSWVDPVEGASLSDAPWGNTGDKIILGLHATATKILINYDAFYGANGLQTVSAFERPKSLTTTGQVVGPRKIGVLEARNTSGYIVPFPTAWQASHSLPAYFVGQMGGSIASTWSGGPSIWATSLDFSGSIGATAYAHYGYQSVDSLAALKGGNYGFGVAPNYYYDGTDWASCAAVVTGGFCWTQTNEVCMLMANGTGPQWYGDPLAASTLPSDAVTNPRPTVNGLLVADPIATAKGQHAHPYRFQAVVYPLSELLAVKSGSKVAKQCTPSSVIDFSSLIPSSFRVPRMDTNGNRGLGGVATRVVAGNTQLILSLPTQDTRAFGAKPVFLVFELAGV